MSSPDRRSPAPVVVGIRRYPVKSLRGEDLDAVTVDDRGCHGDRLWSVRDPDGKLGSGKSTRRFRRMDGLLALAATYDDGVPVIAFPDGRRTRGDSPEVHDALSAHVGRPVTLARENDISHFDEGPVHLVTTATLRSAARSGPTSDGPAVDWRRTRANLLLEADADGFPEHDWVGRRVRVGPELVLRIRGVMPRCVMLNAAQEELPSDPRLLQHLTPLTDGALGVVADVERGGRVSRGDSWELLTDEGG